MNNKSNRDGPYEPWNRIKNTINPNKLHPAVNLASLFYRKIGNIADIRTSITSGSQSGIQRHILHLQPIDAQSRAPSDYWQRLLHEDILDTEIRDQEVIQFVRNTKHEDEALTTLSKRIYNSENFAQSFAYFAKNLNFEYALQLQTSFYKYICQQEGVSASPRRIAGIGELYHLTDHLSMNPNFIETWIIDALPKNLTFAHDLFHIWALSNDSPLQLQERQRDKFNSKKFLQSTQTKIIAKLKSEWKNNRRSIQDFTECLDPEYEYCLRDIVLPYAGQNIKKEDIVQLLYTPKEWDWLAEVIYISLKESKLIISVAPQVAMLLFDRSESQVRINDEAHAFEESHYSSNSEKEHQNLMKAINIARNKLKDCKKH